MTARGTNRVSTNSASRCGLVILRGLCVEIPIPSRTAHRPPHEWLSRCRRRLLWLCYRCQRSPETESIATCSLVSGFARKTPICVHVGTPGVVSSAHQRLGVFGTSVPFRPSKSYRQFRYNQCSSKNLPNYNSS